MQNAVDAINTLCGRLKNATLLEDRRSSIQGLRSFAKDYPESVASGSLRALIASLAKDSEDVDTIKLVLETLINLLNPNPQRVETGEEIPLWLADEFTQREDNLKTLLSMVESSEFFLRLYSIKLITSIYSSRPTRTQECVLTAALATSSLVLTLEDPREPIRNAGLVLLADLTQSSTELQKLVAFEGAYDRLFQLIQLEGGLKEGGIVVQDCLDLLANLIRNNPSNQSLFRESGCVAKLAVILKDIDKLAGGEDTAGAAPLNFIHPQLSKNLWGFLAVTRLFLVHGSVGTNINQKSFEKQGLLQDILNLAFRENTDVAIQSEALYTCGDMIRGNPDLQAGFAQLQVPILKPQPRQNGNSVNGNDEHKIHIIDALLNLVIAPLPNVVPFNVRLAASECIKAYFSSHTEIRLHFLNRAIEGHSAGEDETANILSTLLREGALPGSDPYKVWFASVLQLHLIWNDSKAKNALMKVTEGDPDSGEEVVTCIQTMTGNLIGGIERNEDERILIGYFMLLTAFLYEDNAAVDDLLGEASFLQSLMRRVSILPSGNPIVYGLAALLLGVVYHFSTKDSPISRRKLQPLLLSGMGREKYLQALAELRQHPMIRDFEVGLSSLDETSSPNAYFDSTFVDFLKDNYSKFSRAIDMDPGIEAQVSIEKGVDRDLVDALRSEIELRTRNVQQAETQILQLEQKLEQGINSLKRELEASSQELFQQKTAYLSLQKSHESELQKLSSAHSTQIQDLQATLNSHIADLQSTVETTKGSMAAEAQRTKDYYERSLSQARSTKTNLEQKIQQTQQQLADINEKSQQRIDEVNRVSQQKLLDVSRQMDDIKKQYESNKRTLKDLQEENASWKKANETLKNTSTKKDRRLSEVTLELSKVKESWEDEKTKVGMLEKEVSEKGDVKQDMDLLLVVMSDLEAKKKKYKERLKALGEEVSENEDEDEDGEEDEEEDEVD